MRNFLQKNSRSFTQLLWCFHISHECFDPVPATQIVGICIQKLCICTQLHIDQHFASFLSGQLLIQGVRQKASNLRWTGWDLGKAMRWICDFKNGVQSQRVMGFALNCFSMHPFSNPTTWTVLHTKQMFWQGLAQSQAGLAISQNCQIKHFSWAWPCLGLVLKLGVALLTLVHLPELEAALAQYHTHHAGAYPKQEWCHLEWHFAQWPPARTEPKPALFKSKDFCINETLFCIFARPFSCIVAKGKGCMAAGIACIHHYNRMTFVILMRQKNMKKCSPGQTVMITLPNKLNSECRSGRDMWRRATSTPAMQPAQKEAMQQESPDCIHHFCANYQVSG